MKLAFPQCCHITPIPKTSQATQHPAASTFNFVTQLVCDRMPTKQTRLHSPKPRIPSNGSAGSETSSDSPPWTGSDNAERSITGSSSRSNEPFTKSDHSGFPASQRYTPDWPMLQNPRNIARWGGRIGTRKWIAAAKVDDYAMMASVLAPAVLDAVLERQVLPYIAVH